MPKNISQFPADGRKMLEEMQKNLRRAMSQSAAAIETHYKGSFRGQGFADGSSKWKGRHKDTDKGRATLVKSGDLRRSIKASVSGPRSITLSTDVPYAEIHNEGGTITQAVTQKQSGFFWAKYYEATERKDIATAQRWKRMALSKSLNITIPKRQFMPIEGKNDIPKELQDELRISVENKLKDLF